MAENRWEQRGSEQDVVDLRPVDGSRGYAYSEPMSGTLTVAHIVYGLHTISILIGFATAGMSIAGAFVFSAPSIIAVILNYIFRSDANGTWAESHYSWQIRTFWYALLWIVIIYLVGMLLMFALGLGIFVILGGFLFLGIWVAYRILYGWKRLVSRQTMPM
ncbi:hypothetical protein [Sutterella sp.]|uniref:DUF4870 family protein n=1 Tax=Sutterella sp. TaxID=1981025 RepID=UPI0026DFABBA|nr:hypothetical protein [Sutterella sp.]MDO5530473.1 hypothetical protein [Sutterella sp.]